MAENRGDFLPVGARFGEQKQKPDDRGRLAFK
jgi:hypothetical protein